MSKTWELTLYLLKECQELFFNLSYSGLRFPLCTFLKENAFMRPFVTNLLMDNLQYKWDDRIKEKVGFFMVSRSLLSRTEYRTVLNWINRKTVNTILVKWEVETYIQHNRTNGLCNKVHIARKLRSFVI